MAKSKNTNSDSLRAGLFARAGMSNTRALTAHVARWQSWRYISWRQMGLPVMAALVALALPAQGSAKPARGGLDGPLGTLHRGAYYCEDAGDALGEAGIHRAEEDFTVLHDSVYRTPAGRGSYLLTGQLIVMTSGPKRDERFRRLSDGFLRRLAPDGSETTLRCIRQVLNNQR